MRDTLADLSQRIAGTVSADETTRLSYSTDASNYQERPLGVVFPCHLDDVAAIAAWGNATQTALIPRAGGTSLAGQCVGSGLVVDVSRHMSGILEYDPARRRARVQPGVIQEDLNDWVRGDGLIFGPDTSTADRCMIGGMIGNNACGARSIVHGTTRDHVHRIVAILADGSRVLFEECDPETLTAKRALETREGAIYRRIHALLEQHARAIRRAFPAPEIVRRNTGYALDALLDCAPYTPGGPPFNLCRLLCGSEGTLALVAEAEIDLDPLPAHRLLVAAHCADVASACRAAVVAVEHGPSAVELMDGMIIDGAWRNAEARRQMGWLQGAPGGVLGIEFSGDDPGLLQEQAHALIAACQRQGLGYAFPILPQAEMASVWAVRKAGLGLLMGIPGDAKTVTMIEDAAVAVADLPDYVQAVGAVMRRHGLACCHYGHASVGLLHLRPAIDLKRPEGRETYRRVATEVAEIVRGFGGSLSGEHGDGRLRSPLIARALGGESVAWFREIKSAFDPHGLLNPGKIVDPAAIDSQLRVGAGGPTPQVATAFDWSAQQGLVRAVEHCNGAGVCRRSPGRGTMCPSYQATRDERHSTRGRANVLRQLLYDPSGVEAAWASPAVAEAMELCLSCKACRSECPSSVDMARMKAEWLHQRHQRFGVPWRDRLIAGFPRLAHLASRAPRVATAVLNSRLAKRVLGIHRQRSVPAFARESFDRWWSRHEPELAGDDQPAVVVLIDAVTNYQEPHIAVAAVALLRRAGYAVTPLFHIDDARAAISKGLLDAAHNALAASVERLAPVARAGVPIVGLEPSAILSFRDEAPDLLARDRRLVDHAKTVAQVALTFEEFVVAERERFAALPWRSGSVRVAVHGHCQHKAIAGMEPILSCIRLLPGAVVEAIPSGCCGMAGSFGYDQAHYETAQAVGELVLFPAVRALDIDTLLCASGTSCRHQIHDGVARRALHPAELLYGRVSDTVTP